MFQRLLLLVSVLVVSGVSEAQNVMTPSDGDYVYNPAAISGSNTNPIPAGLPTVVQKWVHDPSQIGGIGSFQSSFKSYRYGTTSFRLRFPENYDPSKKYPIVVFMHGAGEVSPAGNPNNAFYANRENQYQLLHGAEIFQQRILNGEWNGFLLFSQLLSTSPQWETDAFVAIDNILDTLKKYNGLDENRVISMGLSAGGVGSVKYAYYNPRRVASVITSNPRFIESIRDAQFVDPLVQIPIWMSTGGTDNYPGPAQVTDYRDQVATRGGNIFLTYHPTVGHYSWYLQWGQKDIYNRYMLSTYWNSAHKAQPLLYFQNSQFCTGQPISAKMGITANYNAYEWQYDNGSGFATIPGATANTYTATQVGKYRVRFRRVAAGEWSEWTPSPIEITTKACAVDTAFAEHFDGPQKPNYASVSPNGNNSAYFYQNFTCQNGIFVNGTEEFTQDAKGIQGGRFMLNNTSETGCNYFLNDQIWRTVNNVNVTANTSYLFSFYMGNITTSGTPANITARINNIPVSPTNVQTVLTGNLSWKKYSFVWNSGASTSAQLAVLSNNNSGSGNDFVLDEISLVKYTPVMPGGALKNVSLWAKASILLGYDGSPVALWNNSDLNGNNLVQNSIGSQPLLKKNAADNINFNPVVSYNTANNRTNFVNGGFLGSQTHTAAHIYAVTKFNSLANDQTIAYEGGNQTFVASTGFNGAITWIAGTGVNAITTPDNSNELNKPALWTFSKDDVNNTGNGNKQDIRKNGIMLASTNNTSSFTGNGSNFTLGGIGGTGKLNGNIAELIYILDSTISAATENKIESYLAVKYGTTLGYRSNPVTYTASDGSTIWPASATYQADVFGIGTDSLSGLLQTQSNSVNSGSGDGTGQSGRGNLVLSTSTVLADKRFLMIGHDSAALTQFVISSANISPVANGSTRLNREWKVFNKGGVGAVNLSFDSTGLGNLAGGAIVTNYALMIDTDGDGNFDNSTLTFFTATSAAGKKINFSGVTLNNGVVFTIVTLKSNALLPAIWLGFTAEAVNGNALLNWSTSDEMNVDRYVVEHSFNGVSFTTIGSVAANNSTGVNKYKLTDNGLAAGVHYYRIRRIDKDGKTEFSEIKTVQIAVAGANVQVVPNPVTGSSLILAVAVQQSSQTMVQIMSVDGKVLLQKKINLQTGSNLVTLDVMHVPSGVYMVQVQLGGELVTRKFIRQQ